MTSPDLRCELTLLAQCGLPKLPILGYPESGVDAKVRVFQTRCIRGNKLPPEFVPTARTLTHAGLARCRDAGEERNLFQDTYWDYSRSQIDRYFDGETLRSYEEWARATRNKRTLPLPLKYLLRVFKEQPSFLPFTGNTPLRGWVPMIIVDEGEERTIWGLVYENAGWWKNLAVMLSRKPA